MAKKKKGNRRLAVWVIGMLFLLFAGSFLLYEALQDNTNIRGQWPPNWLKRRKDLSAKSLRLEEAINAALSRIGISDADLVTISTSEKNEQRGRWYYFEKQVNLPAGIDIKKLQAALTAAVEQEKGQVIDNHLQDKNGEKILNFLAGFSDRTTHHLVIGQLTSALAIPVKAQVALMIDDIGNNQDINLLEELELPLAAAILPQLSYSSYSVEYALKKNLVPILHLPLEPVDSTKKPGPGVITVGMSEAEIIATLDRDLRSVKGVVGVNSHMGSLATRSRFVMEIVLNELKKRGLFYIDSLVVSDSLGPKISEEVGLVYLTRDVFIDNLDEVNYVKDQLKELMALALKQGRAIGIGHIYHESTRQALKEMKPVFAAEGVAIVPITTFLAAQGELKLADTGVRDFLR